MATVHMAQKIIRFDQSQVFEVSQSGTIKGNVLNKIVQQDAFYFPSNVIGCSLTISQNEITQSPKDSNATGRVTYLGAGIDNISYVGTQVTFTAWIKLAGVTSVNSNLVWNEMFANLSTLTVTAVAQCE